MTSTAHTLGRGGRLRVALAGAVVLVAFTVSTAMAAAAPVGAPAAELGASATSAANPRTPTPGFLLHRGRYRGFDAPQARFSTLAYGINDHGQIVGRYDDGSEQPFLRDRRGRYTTLRIPGARSAWASGINDRGQIVGIYSENTPIVKQPGGRRHGYLWEGQGHPHRCPWRHRDRRLWHQQPGRGGGRLPGRRRPLPRLPLEAGPGCDHRRARRC
jgi:hypothetical protein